MTLLTNYEDASLRWSVPRRQICDLHMGIYENLANAKNFTDLIITLLYTN